MRKSRAVPLSITAAMAFALSGCGSAEPDDDSYQAVCVDQNTQMRVNDDDCGDDEDGSGYYGWYYFPMGSSYSSYGSRVSGGSYARPKSYVLGGAPRSGGTVSKSTVSKSSTSGGKTTTTGKSSGGFGGGAKGVSGG